MHLGDVIAEGDDLYGDDDGVNVVSRLEGEAPPGGIVFLETCITPHNYQKSFSELLNCQDFRR